MTIDDHVDRQSQISMSQPQRLRGKEKKMVTNNYTKVGNEWCAFVESNRYKNRNVDAVDTLSVGDKVTITTRHGDKDVRTVAKIVETKASGWIVSLEPSQEVADRAAKRRASAAQTSQARSSENGVTKPCRYCGTYCFGDCRS